MWYYKVIQTFFHFIRIPDTPAEPDPEIYEHVEPKIMPLEDVSAFYAFFFER